MHVRIDQLLSLRDGEPIDAAIAAHVHACSRCAAELQRLSAQRRALQGLPGLAAPEAWPEIQHRLREQRRYPRRSGWVAGIALLVLGAIFALAFQQQPAQLSLVSQTPAVSDPLVDRSQALEQALSRLPQRPALERAGTAATIDGLEQRIQWVDHHLSQARDTGLNDQQAERLWQERVALLDTLVKVRYAESGSYVF
jgi:hypothetical protein